MYYFACTFMLFARGVTALSVVQVRRVRLHLRLRAQEAASLQELRPSGVLLLRGDLLAEKHAAADLQR